MSDSLSNPNLEYLENRWRRNPGSRIYLQLAEEYRRLERHQDAVEVLTRGLSERSNDLSGWVVLGRCQIEIGALDEAASALEKVLARDPAHMVANKLMVETQLQRGDAERAQERLGFYRLLNDRDPEIDHFEYRLTQIGPAVAESSSPTAVETEASAEALTESSTEAAPVAAEPTPPTPPARPTPPASPAESKDDDGMLFDLDRGVPNDVVLDLPRVTAPLSTRNGQPFGELPALDDVAHWRQLAEGGLFSEELAVSFGSLPTGERDSQSSAVAAKPASDQSASTSEPFDLSASLMGIADVPSDGAPESSRDSVENATVSIPDGSSGNEEEDLAVALGLQTVDSKPESPDAEEQDVDDAVPATAVMGHLYLEQGHHHEAEAVFRRVLAAEPANSEAQQGLARVVEIEAGLRHVSGEAAPSSDRSDASDEVVEEPASLGGQTSAPTAESTFVAEADPSIETDGDAAPAPESESDAEPETARTVGLESSLEVAPALDVAVEPDQAPGLSDRFEASDLLRGEDVPEGLTARKIVALQRYLSLIQQGRDHVS